MVLVFRAKIMEWDRLQELRSFAWNMWWMLAVAAVAMALLGFGGRVPFWVPTILMLLSAHALTCSIFAERLSRYVAAADMKKAALGAGSGKIVVLNPGDTFAFVGDLQSNTVTVRAHTTSKLELINQ